TPKAIEYFHLAGEQAVQRSANVEAVNHLTAALALLPELPASSERDRRELLLRLSLGAPLVATKGVAATEVGALYERALVLAQHRGETALLFPVLRGLWEFHEVRGALSTARELGAQLWSLAQRERNTTLLLIAHGALADTLLWCGDFAHAHQHAEQGL